MGVIDPIHVTQIDNPTVCCTSQATAACYWSGLLWYVPYCRGSDHIVHVVAWHHIVGVQTIMHSTSLIRLMITNTNH